MYYLLTVHLNSDLATDPVTRESPVKVMHLRAGQEPVVGCPQVSLATAAGHQVEGDHCLVARLVRRDTEHITREKHLVSESRIRVILQDTNSGEQFFCWLFGEYSDIFVKEEVKPGDVVVLTSPTTVKTKKKYKQELPANISGWTVHCLTREKKLVSFVKVGRWICPKCGTDGVKSEEYYESDHEPIIKIEVKSEIKKELEEAKMKQEFEEYFDNYLN